MTRPGRASALIGVFAGDYATLLEINGQLTMAAVTVEQAIAPLKPSVVG